MVFPTPFHRFNIVGNAHIFCSESDLLTPACYRNLQSTLLSPVWVNGGNRPALNTGEDRGVMAE